MALLALGINHNSASISIREKVAFQPELMAEALEDARNQAQLEEVVILSTCNRTELIASVAGDNGEDGGRRALEWLAEYHRVPLDQLQQCCYLHYEDSALRHAMRVASGLDSMVLGEPQIFGQMKSAYSVAHELGAVTGMLAQVFQQTFKVAKQVRTDTAIGENPVSVAFAAVSLSQRVFSNLDQTRALLIGAGETIELVARHLVEKGVNQIVVANRTLHRAQELAEQFGAHAVLLGEIPEQLVSADIVISSTASPLPILGKGAVEQALKARKHKPIFMVDIAVPRDIEAQVGDLADVYLYTVDDLKDIVESNKRSRESEARKADIIIEAGIETFKRELATLNVLDTLKSFRRQAEGVRDVELEKAMKQLASGSRAEEVLANLARGLTNKLIHHPSIQMKKASADGRTDIIAWTQDLFGLPGSVDNSEKS